MRLLRTLLASLRCTEHKFTRRISAEDVKAFTALSGDTNPVHDVDNGQGGIVHGAFLLSLVSAAVGTKCPGAGSRLVGLDETKFLGACPVGADVEVEVKIRDGTVRKLTFVEFWCRDAETGHVFLNGIATVRV